jgi:curved DNA-binding protein CbpA
MDKSDLYKILQVDPSAGADVIRAAYRVLAAKHHPDVGGSAEEMARLNAAWNVLSDRAKRAAYDRERRVRVTGDRWDAYGASTGASQRGQGTIIDFGRYAGWSIPELARTDPDFLDWLARTPNGRRYRREIESVLNPATPEPAVATARVHEVASAANERYPSPPAPIGFQGAFPRSRHHRAP